MLLATGWCMASGETLRAPLCLPFPDAFAWLRHSNDVVGHITTHGQRGPGAAATPAASQNGAGPLAGDS